MFVRNFLGLSLVGLLVSAPPVNHPQTAKTKVESSPQLQAVTFPPTTSRGAPSRTRGAGSRGPCNPIIKQELSNLTAVVPENNIGTTVSPNPTVYLYVPQSSKRKAEFALFDWTNRVREPIYKVGVSLPQSAGIIKVSLPKTVELETSNTYIWHFGIICDPEERALDYYINGWLRRTPLKPEIEAKLKELQEKPLELAKLYAELSVWSETITTLEKSRVAYPNAWKELLKSVGLEDYADSKIFDCCQEIQPAQR
ncbi:MAG: DUF928 domain-containing protein [Okeania sp. SIO2G4]|uniref:DUF928 domain-containing protein n=1 Tax=unclassified Okeania TaxID=2634635 RepID=UPI0013B75679|nr:MULTISPECIES: DUF928 domain-containing protein [unclassified Okeania]NEP03964.1 DUF928 domain-containing protein [Okeania sp. SIO4D6]NEP39128.1 DUF928 domain-containing protein [Okeania sp. SIO2H7]NEP74095.1 DUF928 domain-containing protein [Okeania sp. SIO2G5]NEP95303.1 DUF928 domain-containing protein [Okeania sp. SIO2F5]NEQ91971.1 DUF928 domain-containing protein [Okeania sp. SIO2G4]